MSDEMDQSQAASSNSSEQQSTPSKQDELDDDNPIPGEILEKLPEPMRDSIRQTFGILSHGPMQNPIAKKVTSEHITQMIALQDKDSERGYKLHQHGRLYTAGYVVLGIASFFGLAWFFGNSDPELFKQILTYLGTFIGGFAAGWGFTASKGNAE